MHPDWLGVISAILTFAAFLVTYHALNEQPRKIRIPLVFLALIAALPGASFAAYYAHVLPEPSWYYQFRSIAGTELLVVFIGIAGGLVATFLPRLLLILPLLGVTAFSIIPILSRMDDKFLIGDPLRGRELLTIEDLHQRYHFTGFHMRIQSKGNPKISS